MYVIGDNASHHRERLTPVQGMTLSSHDTRSIRRHAVIMRSVSARPQSVSKDPSKIRNPFGAGTVFTRQNLTSVYVRF